MNQASYYLMKNGFILRLEEPLDKSDIPTLIKANLLDPEFIEPMNQDEANTRVVFFRDEIVEMPEFEEKLVELS